MRTLRASRGGRYFIGVTLLTLFAFMLLFYQFHGDINDGRLLFTWIGSLFAYHRLMVNDRANHG